MNGDALNLVLAAIGIVGGGLVSYYFFHISRKERRPVYVFSGDIVVQGDEERDIEVRHKGHEVPLVSRTVVALWNAGRESIRRDDLVENHPLIVKLPKDTVFLETRVLATTKPEIDFECAVDEGYAGVNLGFSFLNSGDGGAIEILHTCDNPWAVEIEGAIVGVEGPPKLFVALREPRILSILTFLPLYAILVLFIPIVVITELTDNPPTALFIPISGLFLLALGVAHLRNRLTQQDMAGRRIPEALREALGLLPPS